MIDLHYWTTPNGHKVTMFLEDAGLDYKIVPVNLTANDQFKPEFLQIAPNNKMPAIVDHKPADGGKPISLFESGAVLQYLAEKSGKFTAKDHRGRLDISQWLFWQVANLGPMAGQVVFFKRAQEKVPVAEQRYVGEVKRLFGVMNNRLADSKYLAGDDYTIADMATYPWAAHYNLFDINLNGFPHTERWLDSIYERPATRRAYQLAPEYNANSIQPVPPRQLAQLNS
jgi:GST-like protein